MSTGINRTASSCRGCLHLSTLALLLFSGYFWDAAGRRLGDTPALASEPPNTGADEAQAPRGKPSPPGDVRSDDPLAHDGDLSRRQNDGGDSIIEGNIEGAPIPWEWEEADVAIGEEPFLMFEKEFDILSPSNMQSEVGALPEDAPMPPTVDTYDFTVFDEEKNIIYDKKEDRVLQSFYTTAPRSLETTMMGGNRNYGAMFDVSVSFSGSLKF